MHFDEHCRLYISSLIIVIITPSRDLDEPYYYCFSTNYPKKYSLKKEFLYISPIKQFLIANFVLNFGLHFVTITIIITNYSYLIS